MKKIIVSLILTLGLFMNSMGVYAAEEKPDVASDYVYLYDRDTGQVFWDQGSTDIIYPASMTKMMTTLVAIEHIQDTSKIIMIDEKIMDGLKEAGASRAGFNLGDEVSLLDLMYGSLLPSGAECTRALAYEVAGSVGEFVNMMNQKAQEIGMGNTHYVNTTGLHDDNHYSTLYDTSLLLETALKNDLFYQIFTSETHKAAPSKNYPDIGLGMDSTVFKFINNPGQKYNSNIEGFLGGKSGYTVEARYCLASIANMEGKNLMLITAHGWVNRATPSHLLDAGIIYNYYNDLYERKTVFNKDDIMKTSKVKYSFKTSSIDWLSDETVQLDLPRNQEQLQIVIDIPDVIEAPIKKGDDIGKIQIYSYGDLIYENGIVSEKTINRSIILFVIGKTGDWIGNNPILASFALVLIVGATGVIMLKKKR